MKKEKREMLRKSLIATTIIALAVIFTSNTFGQESTMRGTFTIDRKISATNPSVQQNVRASQQKNANSSSLPFDKGYLSPGIKSKTTQSNGYATFPTDRFITRPIADRNSYIGETEKNLENLQSRKAKSSGNNSTNIIGGGLGTGARRNSRDAVFIGGGAATGARAQGVFIGGGSATNGLVGAKHSRREKH